MGGKLHGVQARNDSTLKEVAMGLLGKRFQQEFNDEFPKAFQYYVDESGGAMKDVKVEVDWASIGDNQALFDGLKAVWQQTLQGVSAVCADDSGKGAVKEGLKKIVIKNASANSTEMKDGVLTAQMNLAEGSNGSLGWGEYKTAVENGL
jgi:hypothetical protein